MHKIFIKIFLHTVIMHFDRKLFRGNNQQQHSAPTKQQITSLKTKKKKI